MIAALLLQAAQNLSSPEGIHKQAEMFGKGDPWGGGMVVIAMTVVFAALILLYFFFKYLGIYYIKKNSGIKKKTSVLKENPEDVIPAIAMAIFLYNEQIHDEEKTILTIQKVTKTYSPWSSKIYGLRKHPKNW